MTLIAQGHRISDGLLSACRCRQQREQELEAAPLDWGGGFCVPKGSLLYPGTSIPYAADRVNYGEIRDRKYETGSTNYE